MKKRCVLADPGAQVNGLICGMMFFFFILFMTMSVPASLFAESIAADDVPQNEFDEDDFFVERPKLPVRLESRMIEIGTMGIGLDLANNHIPFGDIFTDKLIIDISEFHDGFRLNVNTLVTPLFFNLNMNDVWGAGISFGLDVMGFLDMSGNMLTFSGAADEKSEMGGAVFAEVRLNGFFYLDKFKITVKPALFLPLAYMKPDFTYNYNNTDDGTMFNINYNFSIYTAWPMDNFSDESASITATLGVDLYLGAEYPLSEVLGINERFGFLDFDVGIGFYNVPVVPSSMNDYMFFEGQIGGSEAMDQLIIPVKINAPVYETEKLYVLRPFKMLIWADWRPLEEFNSGNNIITFTPSVGFSINQLYTEVFSVEGGIKARLDLLNTFIATLGINYEDRLWKNSIDFILNLKAVELNLGVNFCSPDFAGSWTGRGLGVNIGTKFGW